MTSLLVSLTPISLIDSLSMLPFAVVTLAVLLGQPEPYRSSVAFVLGVGLSYFASGLVIALGLGSLIDRASEAIVVWWNNPTAIDYGLGVVIGAALIVFGYRWAVARRKRAQAKGVEGGVGPGRTFVFGAGATIAGIWGALPYFAAIDQILKAELGTVQAVAALGYYNLVFVSGPVALIVVRVLGGPGAGALFEKINRLIEVWGKRVLVTLMILLGAVMIVDGVGGLTGRPLIPVGP